MTALPTFGFSLVAVSIGLRRREVAILRLALIYAELARPGLTVHRKPVGIESSFHGRLGLCVGWVWRDFGYNAVVEANGKAIDAIILVVEQGVAMVWRLIGWLLRLRRRRGDDVVGATFESGVVGT